jgi:chlorobactene glucosyltransferase
VPSPFVYALPWLVFPGIAFWRMSRSRHLKDESSQPPADAPRVSVICPARNEALHIEGFVRAALASTYPNFELIVIDDHSTDGTGDIARRAGNGDARLKVIEPPPLPAGWFGKQWACHAGAQVATGELLMFTDADTRHAPELLVRSVNALRSRGSDLLSVAGQQELVTFWERAVQPTIFTILFSAFGGTEAISATTNPKQKIANGQCFLVRSAPYRELNGHVAVRNFAAEDLMIAQQWCAAGKKVHVVAGMEYLSTRMYTSLREVVGGWSKNAFAAGRYVLPDNKAVHLLARLVMPLAPSPGWIPAAALLLGLAGVLSPAWTTFGAIAYAGSVVYSMMVSYFLQIPLWYGFIHPLGSAVATYIYALAAWRGERVVWKEREYVAG